MNTLNVKELISTVRSKSDLEKSDFITDEEITNYLNLAHSHLYNMIVDTNQDFFIKSVTFRASGHAVQLPVDCYKLRALDYYVLDKYFVSAKPIGFGERQLEQNNFQRPYVFSDRFSNPIKYSLRGRELKIFCDEEFAHDYTFVLWYIPKPDKVGEGAELPQGWERYLIHSACMDVRNKQDTSTREFERLVMRDKDDILNTCQRRDFNGNSVIQDVYGDVVDESNAELYISEFTQTDNAKPFAPSYGPKTYLPQELSDFKIDPDKIQYYDDSAVIGMRLPDGLSHSLGNWVIVFMFRDAGNIYLTQRSNNFLFDLDNAWQSMPRNMNIDAAFYNEIADFYGPRKLYYANEIAYEARIDDIRVPPPSTLFKASNQLGFLPYWTEEPSGIVPREEGSLLFTSSGENSQSMPLTEEDAFLNLAIKSPRDLKGIYFDESPVNQIGSFTFLGEQSGLRYYVSRNAFVHENLANTVKVVI